MDFKILRRGIFLVTIFTAVIFFGVLWLNGAFEKEVPRVEDSVPKAEKGIIAGSDVYAWLSDETFFDADKIGDGKYEELQNNAQSLAISASSVDKDLRIKILDKDGGLIKGRIFTATVDGLDKYRDMDRDGYIYVPEVAPGVHRVNLEKISGYNVPESPLGVTVKSNLEYKIIDDISYLIKTEADIDAARDDTGDSDADDESLGNTSIKKKDKAIFGIDVSKFNGTIDWELVKESDVGFAIIRCGYRGSESGAIVKDPRFEENIKGATAAGIPVGVYFFTQAVNPIEAVEEASAVIAMTREYKISYPVFIDSEGAGGNGRADGISTEDRTKAVEAFCETIRSTRMKAGIYASKNWFNNRLDITKLSPEDVIWLAEYKEEPTYGGNYHMWQYSSAGDIPGIDTRVDMNLYFE